jgi:hypothetical protein
MIQFGECQQCNRHSVLAPVTVKDEVQQLCAFCFWKLLVNYRQITFKLERKKNDSSKQAT